MEWRRLDIERIEGALRALLARTVAEESWKRLREEPLSEDIIRRLVEGYRYVDELLAGRISIFGYGESARILELNHRVLCGVSPERRIAYRSHIRATEQHFYDNPRGGVSALTDRYARWQRHAPEVLAAEVYVQTVSTPQLFLEGNSRTAALLASYCLGRAGLPPLVVTSHGLEEYHVLVGRAATVNRDGVTGILGFGMSARKIAHFIRESADRNFLLPRDPGAAAGVG